MILATPTGFTSSNKVIEIIILNTCLNTYSTVRNMNYNLSCAPTSNPAWPAASHSLSVSISSLILIRIKQVGSQSSQGCHLYCVIWKTLKPLRGLCLLPPFCNGTNIFFMLISRFYPLRKYLQHSS